MPEGFVKQETYNLAVRQMEALAAENELLRQALTTCERAIGAPIAHDLAQAAFRACRAALHLAAPAAKEARDG